MCYVIQNYCNSLATILLSQHGGSHLVLRKAKATVHRTSGMFHFRTLSTAQSVASITDGWMWEWRDGGKMTDGDKPMHLTRNASKSYLVQHAPHINCPGIERGESMTSFLSTIVRYATEYCSSSKYVLQKAEYIKYLKHISNEKLSCKYFLCRD